MKQSPPDTTFSKQPFVYLLAILIGGILFGRWLSHFNFEAGLFGFIIIVSLSATLLFFSNQKEKQQPLLFFCLLSGLFLAGILLTIQKDLTHKKNWFGNNIKQTTYYWAEMNASPETKAKTVKISLSVKKIRVGNKWQNASGKMLLYLFKNDSSELLHKGDLLLFPNKLTRIRNRGNPFEFDYAGYLNRQGFYYQSFLPTTAITVVHEHRIHPNILDNLRKHLLLSIQKNIRDTTTAALTEATLLNERTLLNNEVWKAYSITGIAHIIAISGMHVSIFFSILLGLLWWLKAPGLKWVKYLLGLPLIWGYIAITNYPPSAVRAAVLFTILFVCLFLGKDRNPLNFLAVTGMILLCYNPLWLFDTGIQLSFTAIASIFLFFRPIKNLWHPKSNALAHLWGVIAVSLSVQILVFPIVLYYFHQFPVWFLLSNIPASLFSFLLMIMGLLLFLLDGLGIPCIWLGNLMAGMTHTFHSLIFLLAKNTPEALRQLYFSTTEFWILLIFVISICLFLFFKKVHFLITGLVIFVLLITFFITDDYNAMQQQRIIVYNTNHRTSIDYFCGEKCYSIGQKNLTPIQPVFQYVLFPARLGYGIQNIYKSPPTEPFKIINKKRILFLNSKYSIDSSQKIFVDFLILSNSCPFQPKRWKEIFHAKKIILDGSIHRWKALKWTKELIRLHFQVHYVGKGGAWIFPNNNSD